jgi:predicted O-methyltransferase YrrM
MIEDIFNYKLDNFLFPHIYQIKEPIILELGVQKGRSTKKFLELCNKNNGKLFSVDLDDCSNVSKDKRWKFFQTRDDNFEFIKSQIPNKIDVLFIDTLHEANHVKKLFYEYYPLLNINGYIFIDDISHLAILKK